MANSSGLLAYKDEIKKVSLTDVASHEMATLTTHLRGKINKHLNFGTKN
jgi:hypothetical protein